MTALAGGDAVDLPVAEDTVSENKFRCYQVLLAANSLAVLAHFLGLGLVGTVGHGANDLLQLRRHLSVSRSRLLEGLKMAIVTNLIQVEVQESPGIVQFSDNAGWSIYLAD